LKLHLLVAKLEERFDASEKKFYSVIIVPNSVEKVNQPKRNSFIPNHRIRLFQNIISNDLYVITSIIVAAPSLNPALYAASFRQPR
jgi:hypothetical protein